MLGDSNYSSFCSLNFKFGPMQVRTTNIQLMRHKRKMKSTIQFFLTGEINNKNSFNFLFSFRRGKEPFQLSIYSNSTYVRHKPENFQVWKDYPHYASKPGGLKKGFDKLASINILKSNIFMVQELA